MQIVLVQIGLRTDVHIKILKGQVIIYVKCIVLAKTCIGMWADLDLPILHI